MSVVVWGVIGAAIDVGTGAAFKPDHMADPGILKLDLKKYAFKVDYPDCPSLN